MDNGFIEIVEKFKTEEECLLHLSSLRWPNGVVCVYCKGSKVNWLPSRKVYWCGECKKQFSVRVGTIFEGSRIPLRKWFMAIWLISFDKKGVVSNQLAINIGVTQKTAWYLIQRIREAAAKKGSFGSTIFSASIDQNYVLDIEKNNLRSTTDLCGDEI